MLKTKTGQFSVEFIIVLGVLLTIFGIVTLPLYNTSRGTAEELTNMAMAREAAGDLAQAVNNTTDGGVPSRETVIYTLPKGIDNIVFDDGVGNEDNRAVIRMYSDDWEENYVEAETLLPDNTHENWTGSLKYVENLETSQGDHEASVELKEPKGVPPRMRVLLEEK